LQFKNLFFQQFLAATSPSIFVIFLESSQSEQHNRAEKLTIQNAATKEQLVVRNVCFNTTWGFDVIYVEIVRHPIGACAKIREWIKKRAYYEKFYGRSYDETEQIISVERWEPLSIGYF